MSVSHETASVGGSFEPPTPPEKLFGIIGHPLGHSLSPVLHTWNFSRLGLASAYFRWDVPPGKLDDFLNAARVLPIAGVSVTIPHKQAVIPGLDGLTPAATRIGAVNTLFWNEGRLLGDNTDVTGFLSPLQDRNFNSAMVLGAGGAARAVLAGLREKGVQQLLIANRSPERAKALAEEFSATPLPWDKRTEKNCELLVNTTPLGMKGGGINETPWPGEAFAPEQTVYDLVYNPLQTRFLREAARAGCTVLDGLGMFLGQAREQCRLWTGLELPVEQGRKLLEALL